MDKNIFFVFNKIDGTPFILRSRRMATGTFIERNTTQIPQKILIYNACEFEALCFFHQLSRNIKRYLVLKKEKWATLILFHLSFIFILLGVTRHISYEGCPFAKAHLKTKFILTKPFDRFADANIKAK
jgi:hypothetical protein